MIFAVAIRKAAKNRPMSMAVESAYARILTGSPLSPSRFPTPAKRVAISGGAQMLLGLHTERRWVRHAQGNADLRRVVP